MGTHQPSASTPTHARAAVRAHRSAAAAQAGVPRPATPIPIVYRVSPVTDLEEAMRQHGAGRWHAEGQDVIYASATPELAVLEALAHLHQAPDRDHWLCRIALPEQHLACGLAARDLPRGWQQDPGFTRGIGSRWLRAGDTLALHVPSALVSEATNVLVNPAHVQHAQVCCEVVTQFLFDPRFERLRRAQD